MADDPWMIGSNDLVVVADSKAGKAIDDVTPHVSL
jgi:hypothetical protein